jgi:hypothetical protein
LSADEVKNNYEAGRITITSFPSGAEVLVNGVSKGIASPTLSLYGVSPGTYTVKCKLSGYSDYDTNVVLSATGVASVSCSPLPITPTPTPPVLSAYPDPPSFNFGTLNAGASGSRTFSISNTGGGTLTWSVSADQPWITINPTSGANSGTVAININTAGLSPGSYSGTIAVTSNGGTKTGSISLNIPATPPTSQPTTPIPPISQIITTIPPTSQPTTPIPPTSQPTTPIPPISQIITTIPPTSQLTTSTSPQPPSPIDKDVIISLIGALATIIAAYFGYRAYKKR